MIYMSLDDLEIIKRNYGEEKIRELREILGKKINEISVKVCEECGLLEVYCPICGRYHHLDSFAIEHRWSR